MAKNVLEHRKYFAELYLEKWEETEMALTTSYNIMVDMDVFAQVIMSILR